VFAKDRIEDESLVLDESTTAREKATDTTPTLSDIIVHEV
jgi:hypothetical protein